MRLCCAFQGNAPEPKTVDSVPFVHSEAARGSTVVAVWRCSTQDSCPSTDCSESANPCAQARPAVLTIDECEKRKHTTIGSDDSQYLASGRASPGAADPPQQSAAERTGTRDYSTPCRPSSARSVVSIPAARSSRGPAVRSRKRLVRPAERLPDPARPVQLAEPGTLEHGDLL
jgi:hypothetical protein